MLGAQSRGRSRSWDVSEAETRLAAACERHRGHRVAVGAPGSAAKPGHRRPPEGSGGSEVLPSRRVGSAAPSSHRAGGPERRAHLILLGVPSSMAELRALVGGLIPRAPQTAQDSVL